MTSIRIIATTPRLLIREFSLEDQPLFLDLDEDDRLTRYVPKRNRQESLDLFDKTLTEYAQNTGMGRWGIFHKDDNDFIGVCALRPSDYDIRYIELGYRLHLKYWGSGIATELAAAIVNYGLVNAGLKEIFAVTHPQNAASQRVLGKVGFIPAGEVFWYDELVPLFKIEKKEV
jgi:ribosomal-protein-alanine N-acetyltransferase